MIIIITTTIIIIIIIISSSSIDIWYDEVCQYVGGFRHGQVVRDPLAREYTVVGVKPDPQTGELRLWFQPNDIRRPAAGAFPHSSAAMLRGKLARVPAKGERLREVKEDHFGAVEDSDLEDILLCRNCRLPVGEVAYVSAQEEPVHGECMAQIVLQELKQEEDAHRVKESQVSPMEQEPPTPTLEI